MVAQATSGGVSAFAEGALDVGATVNARVEVLCCGQLMFELGTWGETYHLEIVAALEVSVTILAVVMALLVHMLIAIILVAEDGVASLAWKLRLPM